MASRKTAPLESALIARKGEAAPVVVGISRQEPIAVTVKLDPELYWELKHLGMQTKPRKIHIPPNSVVRGITAHRKPPDVRICRLRNQSRVGTVPPSTSTPHWPACCARRW
jgi:hypothetical protein